MQIAGIELSTAAAGIKYQNRDDVLLIKAQAGSSVAGIFTQNAFCAAPVLICRKNLACDIKSSIYLLINAGNANAGTGESGINAAQSYCEQLAQLAGVPNYAVLPFSTGVIGEPLPLTKINAALPNLLESLQSDNWANAAKAIMTTDTKPKSAKLSFVYENRTINLCGIAKGVGMICPNMATMLGFIATDAAIAPPILQQLLKEVADLTFNCITVDGDTSTNDSLILLATGAANNALLKTAQDPFYLKFKDALYELCLKLAKMMVKDGEGATKLVTIEIEGGVNLQECRQVAYAIAHSPLVKTALYASDANWGRILAAVGYAGVENLDVSKVDILIDGLNVVTNGMRAANYVENELAKALKQDEFTISVNLKRGKHSCQIFTCDLSHEYISINASYRS